MTPRPIVVLALLPFAVALLGALVVLTLHNPAAGLLAASALAAVLIAVGDK